MGARLVFIQREGKVAVKLIPCVCEGKYVEEELTKWGTVRIRNGVGIVTRVMGKSWPLRGKVVAGNGWRP